MPTFDASNKSIFWVSAPKQTSPLFGHVMFAPQTGAGPEKQNNGFRSFLS